MAVEAPLRVLLVDDEPLILASYRRILQSTGAEIALAEGPNVGLISLKERPADIVIADYRMPGMNGGEFLEMVRRQWPHTVRILITAYTDAQMIEEVVRRGEIFRFLIKPCDTEKFRQAIKDALDHSRQLREIRRRSVKRDLDLHTYLHLFESALDPMMITDLQGNLMQVNEAFSRYYSGNQEDAILQRPTITSGLEDQEKRWSDIRAQLEESGHWSGEVKRDARVALLSISRISDESGCAYAYAAVEKDVTARHRLEEQSRAAQYEVILALARLAEYRDPETGAHLERIRCYCRTLAEHAAEHAAYNGQIDQIYVEAIYNSSPLHDIGKVGIPDSILLKPGKLTPEEWQTMKQHAPIGGEVLLAAGSSLSEKNWLAMARTISLQHHEKFDGSGYPNGIRGEEIDLSARIVALADAYDAITSKRPYKEALSHEVAKRRILASSGSHFDPRIVEVFLKAESEFLAIRDRYSDIDEQDTRTALISVA